MLESHPDQEKKAGVRVVAHWMSKEGVRVYVLREEHQDLSGEREDALRLGRTCLEGQELV